MTVEYCFIASDILKFHPHCAHWEHNLMAPSPIIIDLLRRAIVSISKMPLLAHGVTPSYLIKGRFSGICLRTVRWNVLRSSIVNSSIISTSLSLLTLSSILCCRSSGISVSLTAGLMMTKLQSDFPADHEDWSLARALNLWSAPYQWIVLSSDLYSTLVQHL